MQKFKKSMRCLLTFANLAWSSFKYFKFSKFNQMVEFNFFLIDNLKMDFVYFK